MTLVEQCYRALEAHGPMTVRQLCKAVDMGHQPNVVRAMMTGRERGLIQAFKKDFERAMYYSVTDKPYFDPSRPAKTTMIRGADGTCFYFPSAHSVEKLFDAACGAVYKAVTHGHRFRGYKVEYV